MPKAAVALYACLHAEWGQGRVVRADVVCDTAWEAVFRYLAPLAARAAANRVT